MTQEQKNKLSKVYELVNNGATEGEKVAAKTQLDKLMKKYNLTDDALNSIQFNKYQFKYSTYIEFTILLQIFKIHTNYVQTNVTRGLKCLYNKLTYLDYVTANCMYEYYRRHSKSQWLAYSKSELAKCRKPKTRAKRRAELQHAFIGHYLYKSKLYTDGQIEKVEARSIKEKEDLKNLHNVEGGIYNQQLHTHLLLTN